MGGPCKVKGDNGVTDGPPCTDNFLIRAYMLNGAVWQSVEQFFQAYKYADAEIVKKFQETVPSEGTSAFEYGEQVKRMGQERHPSYRKNWEQIKVEVTYRAKRAQIAQHPDLQEELIATGDNVLFFQDGNPFWDEWNGKCITRIRDEIMPDGKHPQGDRKRDGDREVLVAAYAKFIENEAFFADCPELVPYHSGGRSSKDWGMHYPESELFAEYLQLAEKSGWDDLVNTDALTIGKDDCLVVVDMQNDFIPVDEKNPKGGAFGVAEGGKIVPTVVKLMEYFGASGALVAATRDYHPVDHCSFIPEGGPFPAHCVQGTVGSKFYPDIALCMANLKTAERCAEVVFKGFHEDIDSFGCLEYPEKYAFAEKRVTSRTKPERLYGCSSLCSWTGCSSLKCSNLANDIDAPPDVLAAHGRVGLSEMLKARGTKRIFACGLALDFCVLDTCLNAMSCIPNVAEVCLLMDAARAAHIPGLGKVGSGFLSDLKDVGDKLRSSKVVVRPCSTVLPQNFTAQSSSFLSQEMLGKVFPEQLGPFAFIPVRDLKLSLDREKQTWAASQDSPEVESLRNHNVDPSGSFSPIFQLTLSPESLEAMGVPRNATQFAWAYSTTMGSFDEQSRAYFAITTPVSAFFVFGGFVYMDAAGEVVAVMSLSAGSGLGFRPPEQLGPEVCAALRGRWQPVTVPDMVRKGARKYAWIPPNEEISVAAGKWTAPPYGCFAYMFHDEEGMEDKRDCYFSVAEMSTRGEVKSLNSKMKSVVAVVASAPAGARKNGEGHFEVTRDQLTVFESMESKKRRGLLKRGNVVYAKGPAQEVGGFTMVPIAPRGAVESKFLRPVGEAGVKLRACEKLTIAQKAKGADQEAAQIREERDRLRAEAAALRAELTTVRRQVQLQPPAARAPVQIMRRCRSHVVQAAKSGELARLLLQLRPN